MTSAHKRLSISALVCYRQSRITSGLRRLARNDDKFSEERRARPTGKKRT